MTIDYMEPPNTYAHIHAHTHMLAYMRCHAIQPNRNQSNANK